MCQGLTSCMRTKCTYFLCFAFFLIIVAYLVHLNCCIMLRIIIFCKYKVDKRCLRLLCAKKFHTEDFTCLLMDFDMCNKSLHFGRSRACLILKPNFVLYPSSKRQEVPWHPLPPWFQCPCFFRILGKVILFRAIIYIIQTIKCTSGKMYWNRNERTKKVHDNKYYRQ